MSAHRQAQGAVNKALGDFSDADDLADETIRQFFGNPKLHNKPAYERLLTFTDGRTMADYIALRGMARVTAILDLSGRLSGAGEIPGLSAERFAEMVAANDALAAQTRAYDAADGAQAKASAAMSAARLVFKGAYRALLKQLVVYYSAEQIAEVLPRFAVNRGPAGGGEGGTGEGDATPA